MRNPDDYTVRMVDLPVDCGGMVSLSPDGHFNIYLNARLDCATQREKYLHELRHILNDDFFNDDDIHTVESRADAHATQRHRLPRLFKASDLLPPAQLPHSKTGTAHASHARDVEVPRISGDGLPLHLGEVARSAGDGPHAPNLTPRQHAVILRAISDLDRFVFSDTPYFD